MIPGGAGTRPTFNWSSGKVRTIAVVEEGAMVGDPQKTMWAIDQLPEHSGGFTPPVTHGELPATGQEHLPARELVAGTRYELVVGDYLVGPLGARPCLSPGRVAFTP